jgi:hypothetical protein
MSGRTGKPGARAAAVGTGTRRSGMARAGYLSPAGGLIGMPKLQAGHSGEKISLGSSAFNASPAVAVEIGLASGWHSEGGSL